MPFTLVPKSIDVELAPTVTFRCDGLFFNSAVMRERPPKLRVAVFTDAEKRRIGFRFVEPDDSMYSEAYKLTKNSKYRYSAPCFKRLKKLYPTLIGESCDKKFALKNDDDGFLFVDLNEALT